MKNRQNLQGLSPTSLAFGLCLVPFANSYGENHVDYRFEDYAEDDGRIHVRTHGLLFETELKAWLSLKGNFIYDGISGATPIGTPPIQGETQGYRVSIEDIRRAGIIEPKIKIENHIFSPQISYSLENDYESLGTAFTHAVEINEKNTTLSWGISHAFDHILPNQGEATPSGPIDTELDKDTTDFLVGVTQIMGPNTVVGANLTIGYSDGYLSDPYKRVLFRDFPYFGGIYTGFPENRPSSKLREVLYFSLQHSFTNLNGVVEGSYRFHHDDWGVVANTFTVQWHQKVTKCVTVSPLFRYHTQTQADFYAASFAGDPSDPTYIPLPQYYSADYRLSELESYTYGAGLSIHVHDRVSIELGYKRYLMHGTDPQSNADQYPKAQITTVGLNVWF